jgi:hypothetical protein
MARFASGVVRLEVKLVMIAVANHEPSLHTWPAVAGFGEDLANRRLDLGDYDYYLGTSLSQPDARSAL